MTDQRQVGTRWGNIDFSRSAGIFHDCLERTQQEERTKHYRLLALWSYPITWRGGDHVPSPGMVENMDWLYHHMGERLCL